MIPFTKFQLTNKYIVIRSIDVNCVIFMGRLFKEESELKDPADSFIYETNKTKHTQTVILEIESK
ncbi:hypothetical protein ACFRH9_03125 [Peribacillus butanolivorans]